MLIGCSVEFLSLIDGSEQTEKAMLIAVDLAIQNQSKIELLHVTQRYNKKIEKGKTDIRFPPSTTDMKVQIINEYIIKKIK